MFGQLIAEQAGIGHLADRLDDHAAGVDLLVAFVEARREAALLVEDGLDAPGFQAGHLTVFDDDLLWTARVEDDDAFFAGFLDFVRIGEEMGAILERRQRDPVLRP